MAQLFPSNLRSQLSKFSRNRCSQSNLFFHSTPSLFKKKKKLDPPRPPLLHEQTTPRRRRMEEFDKLFLHKLMKKNLRALKVVTMTEVQSRMFDPVEKGKDVTVASPVGSGKSLSFLVPWINRRLLDYQQLKKGLYMIILTPTSFNARVMYNEIDLLVAMMGPNITMQAVYDSYGKSREAQRFSKKIPRIVVATPSRLREHIESTILTKIKNSKKPHLKKRKAFSAWFNELTATLVLDEADVLMQVHRQDVEFLLPYMAKDRQTIALSSNELFTDKDLLKPDAVTIDCRIKGDKGDGGLLLNQAKSELRVKEERMAKGKERTVDDIIRKQTVLSPVEEESDDFSSDEEDPWAMPVNDFSDSDSESSDEEDIVIDEDQWTRHVEDSSDSESERSK